MHIVEVAECAECFQTSKTDPDRNQGFVRIRHFGFLGSQRRSSLLPLCFAALHAALLVLSLHLTIQYFLYFGRNAPMLGLRELRELRMVSMT